MNLDVIALGDLFQLPPVPPGEFVFEKESLDKLILC